MRTSSWRIAAFGALCMTMAPLRVGSSYAAVLILPIEAHATLADESGTTGILIDFGTLDTLKGKKILYAKCYLNIPLDSCTSPPNELDLKPLAQELATVASGSVSLTDTTGGALSASYSTEVDAQRGRGGDTEILLTELIQAWVDNRMANHGLALLPRSGGCSLELLTRSDYPGTGYGKLLVKFVDTSQ